MNKIIEQLSSIYFSRLEALIYVELLKNPGQTVYQLSKSLNISRSSIYPVIEKMYEKSIVMLVNQEALFYYPQNPSTLLKKLKHDYNESISSLEKELSDIKPLLENDRFLNIVGQTANIEKTKELLLKSQKEVYLNTDIDLDVFDEEFKQLEQKNVRVIVFSFIKSNYKRNNVEIYSKGFKRERDFKYTRIMIVSDYQEALIASLNGNSGQWIGTLTNNHLMIEIASEHIHHDIYLLKIEEQTGHSYFTDENKQIYLNTINEQKIK